MRGHRDRGALRGEPALQAMLTAGALPAYTTPPPSLQAAYRAEPALARLHLSLSDYLRQALTATLLGVLPRD